MKLLKSTGLVAVFFCLAIFASACGSNEGNSADATQTEANHGEGKEYNAAYVCPMHCEGSGSEEPGKCPVCGMAYVEQSEHTKDGHNH